MKGKRAWERLSPDYGSQAGCSVVWKVEATDLTFLEETGALGSEAKKRRGKGRQRRVGEGEEEEREMRDGGTFPLALLAVFRQSLERWAHWKLQLCACLPSSHVWNNALLRSLIISLKSQPAQFSHKCNRKATVVVPLFSGHNWWKRTWGRCGFLPQLSIQGRDAFHQWGVAALISTIPAFCKLLVHNCLSFCF